MTNPNKYIRQAIITGLQPYGYSVWYKRVPKSVVPTPTSYILIDSQSKQEAYDAKECFEWLCQVNINIWIVGQQGFPPTTTMDDIEEKVITAMKGIQDNKGLIKRKPKLINQTELSVETDTNSIERRILTYEIWVNKQ